VLYTRGRALVDWNGVAIPVQDGSYAYEGGETVTLEPDAMGLLRLSDGSSVFICPGATARLRNTAGGAVELELIRGSSRFAFPRDRRFLVRANAALLGPSDLRPESRGEPYFVGEARAHEEGTCVLCALKNDISLALERAPERREHAQAGTVAEIRPQDATGDGFVVGRTPIPDEAMALIRAASAGDGAGGQYLCRCDELYRYARERGSRVAAQDQANQPPGTRPQVPDAVPEILPPDAPPLALAEPGPPDPFDPNLLPPPAAGEPGDAVVTVAPPAVPGGGTGGGGVASPS
jgi:hypothetical protein